MKTYNIQDGQLWNDLDCPYNPEENRIEVYSSVYWTAETETEYQLKESIINTFKYEDELVKAWAWCDISGYDYWVVEQEEENYVSIDVELKKPVEEYSQEEIKKISDLISKWDEDFYRKLMQ